MISLKSLIGGFPRIGENRELKKALEQYWNGKIDQAALKTVAAKLRSQHWRLQTEAGLDMVCVNDFSFYDQMLDTAVLVGAIPPRFRSFTDPLERYFAMARGTEGVPPLSMKKWFNTNYHYFVPELETDQTWQPDFRKPLEELAEARSFGFNAKISLIGPLTFLRLSRLAGGGDPLSLLPSLLSVYARLVSALVAADANVLIQMDEPILVCDPDAALLEACETTYRALCSVGEQRILVSTYFEHAAEALPVLAELPLWGIGLDFIYGEENLEALEQLVSSRTGGWADMRLIAGVVDGRNVWAGDRPAATALLARLDALVGRERVVVASSCSLLHLPYRARTETGLPPQLSSRLAFACEKLEEVSSLGERTETTAKDSIPPTVPTSRGDLSLPPLRVPSAAERKVIQREFLKIPLLPTTTIGSFPQTQEVRSLRSKLRSGKMTAQEYEARIKEEIQTCIRFQEEAGLDVLVHGEFERNDMVEFFGEKLDGFAFTANGWVQSYGSRCVKPPIIYGTVSRPEPMTVDLISFAQSLTQKPVKGMLTGPVTILNWSFVRRDIPRSQVCLEIAEALKAEILDLEAAGIGIIQVDEAAFKEGYPLRKEKRAAYEQMAVACFRTAAGSVKPRTQIHSHMCYSEFSDIMETVNALDVDVLSVETTRDGDRLLATFQQGGFDRDLGPGIYDIHSPAIPSVEELIAAIQSRIRAVGVDRLWVNPDCGLKTRSWAEAGPSIRNITAAREACLNTSHGALSER
ncbi:MAG: 5-methyltetrahydropteroyltriglutamate--homocysteine S-methyltransferase [Treponema sp.]|nr:5-methyltetrahydropteroyltriglutamate--homocysteine S-methyltransferase [Treponema sp.]